MLPSQLLLDHYYLEELSFSLSDDYNYESGTDDPKLLPEDLDVKVESFRHPENPLQWMFKLRVRLENKESKLPYSFSISLSGFFDISEDCPQDMIERLALVNAPSILYASARELLAVVTARSRFLTIFLPSVSFFEPPKETKPKAIVSPPEEAKENAERKTVQRRKRSGAKAASRKK